MESPAPEVSRVCLDRREMKVPEASLDLLVPLAYRLVPFTHIHIELTFDVPSLPQNIYINKVCIYALILSSSSIH